MAYNICMIIRDPSKRELSDCGPVDYAPFGSNPENSGPEAARSKLLKIRGVQGVGWTLDEHGDRILVVYLDHSSHDSNIPQEVDGWKVVTQTTGPIRALDQDG